MHTIYIEMPTGMRSRGYDRATEDEAAKAFDRMVSQLKPWKNFVADVVMSTERGEIRRERISNA